jgi:quercetin dioxygenase-like cupin family protein
MIAARLASGREEAMSTTTQPPDTRARTVGPGGGERIWIAGDTVWITAGAAETGGAYTMLEIEAAPGGGPPPHVHDHEDETFYVLDGEFELLIGDRLVHAPAGAFALVPRGTVHRFRCAGDRPGRLLVIFTPGGLDGFFREAGAPAVGDGAPPPVDEAEIARTAAAGERYGLHVVAWGV